MSTLKQKAEAILAEKTSKIIPSNIKKNIQIFDITGNADVASVLPNPDLPEELDYNPIEVYRFTIDTNISYDSDIIIKGDLYSKSKESDNWDPYYAGGQFSMYGTPYSSEQDKLCFDFDINMWELDAEHYDFKIVFFFIKEGYEVKICEVPLNIIIPDHIIYDIAIMGPNGSATRGLLNENDIKIYNPQEELVAFNVDCPEDYYYSTFKISFPYEEPLEDYYNIVITYENNLVWEGSISKSEIQEATSQGYQVYLEVSSNYNFPSMFEGILLDTDDRTNLAGRLNVTYCEDKEGNIELYNETVDVDYFFQLTYPNAMSVTIETDLLGYQQSYYSIIVGSPIADISLEKDYNVNTQARVEFSIYDDNQTIVNDLTVEIFADSAATQPFAGQTQVLEYIDRDTSTLIKKYILIGTLNSWIYVKLTDPQNRFKDLPCVKNIFVETGTTALEVERINNNE